MSDKRTDQSRAGVTDAWDFWLSQHDVSVPEIIADSVQRAVTEWLDANTEDLIEALAAKRQPITPEDGPPAAGRDDT